MADAVQEQGFALEHVRVTDPDGAVLLDDVDLVLPGHAWSAIIGASGSGKTTLLRLLNRLADPSSGCVRFDGRPLPSYEVRALRRMVALVVQQPRLTAGSVAECLTLPVRLGALDAHSAERRLPQACSVSQLDEGLLARDVAKLSGGERQRVALARALMLEPAALLLDEPTAALDRDTARRLIAALEALRRERGTTLVVVTHRIEELTALCPFCAVLERGRVIEQGPASELSEAARIALGMTEAHAPAD